ncbi:hypothetical protein EJB05_01977, partial [Eragrostis curvula]
MGISSYHGTSSLLGSQPRCISIFFSHSVPCTYLTYMEQKARRRRRVPAFGQWNYYYYSGEVSTPAPAAAEWYAPASETEACSDVWFKYSPPSRKPPPTRKKQVRRPETVDKSYNSGGKRRVQAATPARASDAGARKAARPPPAKAAASKARVVRSVDADLYQVPPPDFEPDQPRRRKASRSVWMACLGFGCCVA